MTPARGPGLYTRTSRAGEVNRCPRCGREWTADQTTPRNKKYCTRECEQRARVAREKARMYA